MAESCREEDPLTCHKDCWWDYSVFFVSSCRSPQREESFTFVEKRRAKNLGV